MVEDHLDVICLTCLLIRVRELIIAQTESSCGIALRETEHYVVACIVETAGDLIGGMAVASPFETASGNVTAHIGVVEIEGILKESCVIVVICRSCRERGSSRGERTCSRGECEGTRQDY